MPVVAGQAIINDRAVAINTVSVHPQAASGGNNALFLNDVAIIQLAESVSHPTLPLALSEDTKAGDRFSIFGFGLDEKGGRDVLRSGEAEVSSVTDQHIISNFNGEGSNSCSGDSGGPAVRNSFQWANRCCRACFIR